MLFSVVDQPSQFLGSSVHQNKVGMIRHAFLQALE